MSLVSQLVELGGALREGSASTLQVAAALRQAEQVVPALRDYALAASVVTGLRNAPDTFQRTGIASLLEEGALGPLAAVSLKRRQAGRLRGALGHRVRTDLFSSDAALTEIASKVVGGEASTIRPMLRAIARSGGLADLVLKVEEVHLGIDPAAAARARSELRRLEKGMAGAVGSMRRVNRADQNRVARDIFRNSPHLAAHVRFEDHAEHVYLFMGMNSYLFEWFRFAPFSESPPLFLTDLLRQGPVGERSGDGSCSPQTTLLVHLAHLAGMSLGLLFHNTHANLFDQRLGLVFEATGLPIYSPLELWKRAGLFPEATGPLPLEAMVSATLMNMMPYQYDLGLPEQAERYARAALDVHPAGGHSRIFTYLAGQEGDPERKRAWIQRAIDLHPRDPLGWVFAGDAALERGDVARARGYFARALQLILENRDKILEFFGPQSPFLEELEDLLRPLLPDDFF